MARDAAATTVITTPATGESVDKVILPHLDAAHRPAPGLMGNDDDAEDVLQEASLRAGRHFRGSPARMVEPGHSQPSGTPGPARDAPWKHSRTPFDEEQHRSAGRRSTPRCCASVVERTMSNLGHRHELLVLGKLKDLSYRELADVMGIPVGTVMSRLARAREALRSALDSKLQRPRTPARTHIRKQEADAVVEPRGRDQRYGT